MRRLFTGLLSLALSLAFMTLAIPAHADTAADAQWVLDHQSKYTAAQIQWACGYLKTCGSPPPNPAPAPAPSPTGIKIASQAALDSGLASAKGGETFALAAGNYSVVLSGKVYSAPVVITSADPVHPARVGWHKLTNVTNLTFRGIEMGTAAKTANPGSENVGKVSGGAYLTYDSVFFHGSLDDNALNDMLGPNIGGVNGLKIVNSRFEQLYSGLRIGGCTNVTLSGNIVRGVRSDGFNLAAVDTVLIERNRFSDFQRNTHDHPDAIQFWTQGTTKTSRNITIRGNIVMQGSGNGTQGIFLADQVGTLPYANVLIENNLVIGSNMANGIFPSHVNGLTVRNNTVVSPIDDGNPVWIRIDKSTGVSVTGNIADQFNGISSAGNKLTKDSGIDLKLLTTANLPALTPAQLVVPGIGYQPQ